MYSGAKITNRKDFHNALTNLQNTTLSLLTALDAAQNMSQYKQNPAVMCPCPRGAFVPYRAAHPNACPAFSQSAGAGMVQQCPAAQQFPQYANQTQMAMQRNSYGQSMGFNPMATNMSMNQGQMGYMGNGGGMGGPNYIPQNPALYPQSPQNKFDMSPPTSTLELSGEASLYLPIMLKMTIVDNKGYSLKIVPNSIEILKEKLDETLPKPSESEEAPKSGSKSPSPMGSVTDVEPDIKPDIKIKPEPI